MKKLFFLIFTIVGLTSFGQTILTYKGSFQGARHKGEAEYQYYENTNNERIYHGSFKFSCIIGGAKNVNVNGQFKKNLKNGTWKYLCVNNNNTKGELVKESLIGNYVDGKMEGKWIYSGNRTNSLGEIVENMKSIANFSENNFIGFFEFTDYQMRPQIPNDYEKFNVTGSFTKTGRIDSVWNVRFTKKKINYESVLKYKNGVMYYEYMKDVSTGEITGKIDSSKFINVFFEDKNDTIKSKIIGNMEYGILSYEVETKAQNGYHGGLGYYDNDIAMLNYCSISFGEKYKKSEMEKLNEGIINSKFDQFNNPEVEQPVKLTTRFQTILTT